MGYVMRVRVASFFAGAAVASTSAIYFLYQDYKLAHLSISDQMKRLHDSLDQRLSALEKLKEAEVPQRQMKRLHDSLDQRLSALQKLKEAEVPQRHVESSE